MLTENCWALKEWSGVCAGLITGKSCLILRKGGIREDHDEFVPEHQEFWNDPTQFHQTTDQFSLQHQELAAQKIINPPASGMLSLSVYAVVTKVFKIHHLEHLDELISLQLLSREVIHQRFQYKNPGICGMVLNCLKLPQLVTIPELAIYQGCKSWVELNTSISTQGLVNVTPDDLLNSTLARINHIIST